MLAFADEGSGPALVLLHGISVDRTRWAPVVEQLTDGFRCLSVDLPGHGASPDAGCDVLSAAVAVQELLDALEVSPAAVVGHSLGASVALVHAALHGPRSAVAVDPAPLFLPHAAAGLAPFRERLLGDGFDAAFAEWEARFDTSALPEPSRSSLVADRRPRQDVVLSYWRSLLDERAAAEAQEQYAAGLAAIAVPVLVCLADPPSAEDASLLGGMATATVEVHAGGGHFLHLVDPPGFAARLRRWVSELP